MYDYDIKDDLEAGSGLKTLTGTGVGRIDE